MKQFIYLFLLIPLLIPGSSLAQEGVIDPVIPGDEPVSPEPVLLTDEQREEIIQGTEIEVTPPDAELTVEAAVEAEAITNDDLEVGDPGLLPTSPFYFFKEIGRGLQRAFTFDAVKKAELELKFAGEKAIEAKKIADQDPTNERGISRALINYGRMQERLRERIERLDNSSENPNIDRLFDQIVQRQVAHEKLLEELEAKHDNQESAVNNVRARVEGVVGEVAKKDTVEKFQKRLEKAFEDAKGGTLKHVRSVEILDRLRESDEVSDEIKERIESVRNTLSERARESVERFVEEGEDGAARLQEILKQIPGNAVKRTIVLEELRARASDRTANALGEARDSLDKTIKDGDEFTEQVRKRIEMTEERIKKIEQRLEELGEEAPQAARSLLENAKKHIEKAKIALAEGNSRNAFGLSRAAEAIIANIFRIFEKGIDSVRDAPQILDRVKVRIQEVPFPLRPKPDVPSTEIPGVFCTQEYNPVCGADGKTYSNRCVAEQQNKVRVKHEGECRKGDGITCPIIDRESLERNCSAKGGAVVINRSHRCGPTPECIVTEGDPIPLSPSTSAVPVVTAFSVQADDSSFSPSEIRVKKGAKVTVTFHVSTSNVYFGGLDFRSDAFTTGTVAPGDSTTVEFTADESFRVVSYWPLTNDRKAVADVIVE